MAAGRCASFALGESGAVWGWGCAQANGLAPAADRTAPAPLRMPGARRVVSVAAGEYFGLAVFAEGGAAAWGAHAGSQEAVLLTGVAEVARPHTHVSLVAAGYQHVLVAVDNCEDGRPGSQGS